MLAWLACSLACLRACVVGVLSLFMCFLVYVLSILACFISFRTHMSYMLAVVKYLTCSCACVLGVLVCPIYFIFEKLNSKNCIEKFVSSYRSI